MKKYLSGEEIDFYKNQGAIVIKNVFKPWIDLLRIGFEKVLKEPKIQILTDEDELLN